MFSASKTAAPSALAVSKSLRFRSSSSANVYRTYTTPTASSWTMSVWVKRGTVGTSQAILNSSLNRAYILFNADNTITAKGIGTGGGSITTTAVFVDSAAWYHLVVNYDGTNANIYVNNVLYATGAVDISINRNAASIYIGAGIYFGISNFDGYLASFYFIDGQALTPSSFGYTNPATNVWTPKAYAGTYGINGSALLFTNATNTTTIVADSSGNGNNWTASGISLTSGVTYDSMPDVPIPVNATTGNFGTFNPSTGGSVSPTFGNLAITAGTGIGNFSLESGSYYFEVTTSGSSTAAVNLIAANGDTTGSFTARTVPISSTNGFRVTTSASVLTLEYTTDGTSYTTLSNTFASPYPNSFLINVVADAATTAYLNCGQQTFTFSIPSGYSRINTFNLPVPSAGKGSDYMAPTLYTGTGASLSVSNGSFLPGFVWIKNRLSVYSHLLTDVLRGVTKTLSTNSTNAETTNAQGLQSFNSTGFTIGTDAGFNTLSNSYVAWQWASGTPTSNTDGIPSTVAVNTNAGFSIVTYDGVLGIPTSVGHGLGTAPSFYITKEYNASGGDWAVYTETLYDASAKQLTLNSNGAAIAATAFTTTPTSTLLFISAAFNGVGKKYVAYCWARTPGFSSFGSYSGTGYTAPNGPYIVTGFKPAFIMIKKDGASANWFVFDSTRNTYNNVGEALFPNNTDARTNDTYIQILSNGFKINTTQTSLLDNASFYYAAFSQNPFKYAIGQ